MECGRVLFSFDDRSRIRTHLLTASERRECESFEFVRQKYNNKFSLKSHYVSIRNWNSSESEYCS